MYELVLAEDEDNERARALLVNVYLRKGETAKALEELEQLRSISQDPKKVDFTIGRILLDEKRFDVEHVDNAWCPGCGDFGILRVLKKALAELDIAPQNLVMVSTNNPRRLSILIFDTICVESCRCRPVESPAASTNRAVVLSNSSVPSSSSSNSFRKLCNVF